MHHNVNRPNPILRLASVCMTGAMLSMAAAGVMADATKPASDIQSRYEQERAKCLNGSSNQDQATCLKEAGAARDAASKGQLNDDGAQYRKNAKDRCNALAGDEQRDCLARMRGAGTTSGSAEAGGIYRETVTRKVGPVTPAASVPSP
jgi:hypothetical protein